MLLAQRLQSNDSVRLDNDRHATQMRRDKPLNKCDVLLFIDPHPDSYLPDAFRQTSVEFLSNTNQGIIPLT